MRYAFPSCCSLLCCGVAALVLPGSSLMCLLAFCRRWHLQSEWRVQNEARRISAPCPGAVWHRVQLIRRVRECCFLRACFLLRYSNCCCTAGSPRLAFVLLQVTAWRNSSSGQRRCTHRSLTRCASGARRSRQCGGASCQAPSCHVSDCVRFSCATALPRFGLASCFGRFLNRNCLDARQPFSVDY